MAGPPPAITPRSAGVWPRLAASTGSPMLSIDSPLVHRQPCPVARQERTVLAVADLAGGRIRPQYAGGLDPLPERRQGLVDRRLPHASLEVGEEHVVAQ